MDVDSTVKFPGTSATSLPWSGVEVLQDSVITQSAHHTEPESGCSRNEIIAGEQAVTDKNVGYAEELFPMVVYRPEAFCRLIVAHVLHVFKIVRRTAFRGERQGLYGEKKSRVADPGGDLRETENLKTSLCRAGSPRPVSAKSRRLPAGFAEKTVVEGDGRPVSVRLKEHVHIEGAPVELPLEVLSEAALAGVSWPGHRQEFQSSVYRQYQKSRLFHLN